MKRLTVCILVFLMAVSLAACGQEQQGSGESEPADNQSEAEAQPADGDGSVLIAYFSQNPLSPKKNDDGQKKYRKRRETDLEGNPL